MSSAPVNALDPSDQTTIDTLIVLFEIRDKGQARMLKHCDPALKRLKEVYSEAKADFRKAAIDALLSH